MSHRFNLHLISEESLYYKNTDGTYVNIKYPVSTLFNDVSISSKAITDRQSKRNDYKMFVQSIRKGNLLQKFNTFILNRS